MVLIPAATYLIGSDNGQDVSRPAHPVPLAAFGIDVHEVTVGAYEPFVQAGLAAAPWGSGSRPDGNLPVTRVTFSEASNYCAWRHPRGGRLPTEEEWEATARGSAGRVYPWGEVWDRAAANTGSRLKGPAAVGSFPRGRTPEGVYDLIGNAWEWTSSRFKIYGDLGREVGDLYVIRGGAYNAYDEVATSTFRGRAAPATARENLLSTGFRCAMTPRESPR